MEPLGAILRQGLSPGALRLFHPCANIIIHTLRPRPFSRQFFGSFVLDDFPIERLAFVR